MNGVDEADSLAAHHAGWEPNGFRFQAERVDDAVFPKPIEVVAFEQAQIVCRTGRRIIGHPTERAVELFLEHVVRARHAAVRAAVRHSAVGRRAVDRSFRNRRFRDRSARRSRSGGAARFALDHPGPPVSTHGLCSR
jgi:hypothetical protein